MYKLYSPMAYKLFREDTERVLSCVGCYGQVELHYEPIQVIAVYPEKAYGLAHYHPTDPGWVVWRPNQAESELENVRLTRQQAIETFLEGLLPVAYLQGFRVLLSTN